MKHRKTNLVAASLALLLLSLSAASFAQEQAFKALDAQLLDLNSAIHKKGAKWNAAETSLSRLSDEEMQKRVGTVGLKINAKSIPESTFKSRSALPKSLDWREKGGVSAVKDQKKCGSCWAFAMTAGLESNALLSGANQSKTDLSEQVLVSCSGVGSCDGGTLDGDFLAQTGLPPEKYYPYTATDGDCSQAAQGWQQQTYKIGSWGSVSQKLSTIKSALAKYGPLPTAYMVYEDFKHYKSGIYSYVSGKKLGGHAVLLVGYNDAEQYFIVKNSWGPDWGEDGYFRIAYSEMNDEVKFGMSTIAYESADPGNDSNYQPWMAKEVQRGKSEVEGQKISQKINPLLEQKP